MSDPVTHVEVPARTRRFLRELGGGDFLPEALRSYGLVESNMRRARIARSMAVKSALQALVARVSGLLSGVGN